MIPKKVGSKSARRERVYKRAAETRRDFFRRGGARQAGGCHAPKRETEAIRILIDNGNTPAAPRPYIGHYGRLRKAYLEQYRPDLYTALVANEKLHEHCAEIDEAARSRIDLIMPQLARSAGATEALKATDPMKWVGLMNACRAQAEEIAKFELIYV